MLWIKAFHVIFMVTWFAGLTLLSPATGHPGRVRDAAPEVNSDAASLAMLAGGLPWPPKQSLIA